MVLKMTQFEEIIENDWYSAEMKILPLSRFKVPKSAIPINSTPQGLQINILQNL